MRNIIVTGGNRGLGQGVASHFLKKGDNVCVTVRSPEGLKMVEGWKNDLGWFSGRLDITFWDAERPWDIDPLFLQMLEVCDVLVNNAGVCLDLDSQTDSLEEGDIFSCSTDKIIRSFMVNVEAPRVLMSIVFPHMRSRGYGRVVNLASSRAKSFERVGDLNLPSYRLSKAALVSMTQEAAHEFSVPNVKFNALCPGWCQTRMGGADAPDSIEAGVEKIVALCDIGPDGPHGGFFVDNQMTRMS